MNQRPARKGTRHKEQRNTERQKGAGNAKQRGTSQPTIRRAFSQVKKDRATDWITTLRDLLYPVGHIIGHSKRYQQIPIFVVERQVGIASFERLQRRLNDLRLQVEAKLRSISDSEQRSPDSPLD